jgi:flagellar motor switch/type III secretory pathway protein FliN
MSEEIQLALNDMATPLLLEASLRRLHGVPLRLAVTIPVPGTKLRDLRVLRIGKVLTTVIPAAEDVPVRVGGALLGWAELDSADGRMAIRLTRLS